MKGKHYYFTLTTASVVWFKVMTMILQNVIKNTPLHKSFHISNFNQMINIWTPKEHINDDILSQIRKVTVHTTSFKSPGRFIKGRSKEDWRREMEDNPETTISSLHHDTYNISAPGNIFKTCFVFKLFINITTV